MPTVSGPGKEQRPYAELIPRETQALSIVIPDNEAEVSAQVINKTLAPVRQLQTLHLDFTGVTDAGLEHLLGLGRLQFLTVFDTKVTYAGLVRLKGLKELQTLRLKYNTLTDQEVVKLQEALPKCKIDISP